MSQPAIELRLDAVIVAVTEEVPRVLALRGAEEDALPFGPLDVAGDRTLESGLRRWVADQTGIELGYVEQLYTFGDRFRDPAERGGGPRAVSVAYLALAPEEAPQAEAAWRDAYAAFPWEDWRAGRPAVIARAIEPALDAWVRAAETAPQAAARRERAEITFGLGPADWDVERVLARYELLYEIGLVQEAHRDRAEREGGAEPPPSLGEGLGRPMALDHRRILATALGRLRGKIKYRPLVFELLPPSFTLTRLQRVVEALSGVRLHTANFRRLVERGGLVEGTGRMDEHTGGRPAELHRFRREVLRERRAPGVGLPGRAP